MSRTTIIAIAVIAIVLGALNAFQYYQMAILRDDISSLEENHNELVDDYEELSDDYDELEDDYKSLEESYPRTIADVKGPQGKELVGKNVTVEGYFAYIAGKYPILVPSLDYLQIDMYVPDDKFLELTGNIPQEFLNKTGSRLYVTGTVEEEEGDIILEFIEYRRIYRPLYPWLEIIGPITIYKPGFLTDRYAVLISGGYRAASAYLRYWNDLKYMYSILINRYFYRAENIYVIYKDGIGEDTDMPVNYSATVSNVQAVFDDLATKMTSNDKLFIFMNNHGGGFHPTDPYGDFNYGLVDSDGDEPEAGYSESAYGKDFNDDGDMVDTVKIDEVLCLYYYQLLSDDALADMLDDLQYSQMIIFMKQCFSGGFIHDLSGTNRIILASCTEEQFSWSADTEGSYGEFSIHFMRAVNLEDLDADVDDSGSISMVEAFNYASQQDSRDEIPHYDDNGDQIGNSEPIPNGGDGITGSNAYL